MAAFPGGYFAGESVANGTADGVAGAGFSHQCGTKQSVCICVVAAGGDGLYGEMALRERSGFIKYCNSGFGKLLKMIAALDQNAAATGSADAAKKAERNGNDKRTGTADHQKTQRAIAPFHPE